MITVKVAFRAGLYTPDRSPRGRHFGFGFRGENRGHPVDKPKMESKARAERPKLSIVVTRSARTFCEITL